MGRSGYLPIACVPVAAVFVSILVLHARLNASSSSIIIEIAVAIPIVMVAMPAAISTIPPIAALHSQISIPRAIITVVGASTRGVVTQLVALLCLPIATDTNILAAFLVLLPRLFRLLRGPLGLNGSGLRLAWSRSIFGVLSE